MNKTIRNNVLAGGAALILALGGLGLVATAPAARMTITQDGFILDCQGGSMRGVTINADNVTVKNCAIDADNSNAGGIAVNGNGNKVLENNIINACMAGIIARGDKNIIEDNEISRSRQCAGSSGPDADGIRFFQNGNIIRGNFIHDIRFSDSSGSPHIDCFQTWGGASDTLIENNICDNYYAKIGENNGTTGANLENDVRTTFKNNYFHVYGKGILFESSSSGGKADNNIFISGPKIAGALAGQYCLFGNSTVNGNICYLYTNVLIDGASGSGNVTTNPQMDGYCSSAFPSKGAPCGGVVIPTFTPAASNTPTKTRTPSPSPSATDSIDPGSTPSETATAAPSNTASATPTRTPSKTPTATQAASNTPTKTRTPSPTPSKAPIPSITATSSAAGKCAYISWPRGLNIRPAPSLFNGSLGFYFYGKIIPIEGTVTIGEDVWAKVNEGQYFALKLGTREYANITSCR